MSDFTVDDGWMTESSVRELAEWYHSKAPETDALSFETHLMALRAYTALTNESPLEIEAALSRARYAILRFLDQSAEKRLLMGDLVHFMNVSPTNVTKLVDTLVADGLVERLAHDVDKRKTWAKLTPAGVQKVDATVPRIAAHVASLWSCLTEDEKRTLVHLLAKLRQNARELEAKPSSDRQLASA